MRILDFGSTNIDYVYTGIHIVIPEETCWVEEVKRFDGESEFLLKTLVSNYPDTAIILAAGK